MSLSRPVHEYLLSLSNFPKSSAREKTCESSGVPGGKKALYVVVVGGEVALQVRAVAGVAVGVAPNAVPMTSFVATDKLLAA